MFDTNHGQYKRGVEVRREVLGGDHVDRSMKAASEFSTPIQEMANAYAWGEIWANDDLDRRTRSLLNLAMLTSLNRPYEFSVHVRGAINNGCTVTEIRETLRQTAIYCGLPAALEAFRLAERVLKDLGIVEA